MIKLSIESKNAEDIKCLSRMDLQQIFTPREISGSNDLSLAGKLAAKSAFLKNAGLTCSAQHLGKIEIEKTRSSRPVIKIDDSLLSKQISTCKTAVSISHIKEMVVAICVLYDGKI